jgi:hypothetical protein
MLSRDARRAADAMLVHLEDAGRDMRGVQRSKRARVFERTVHLVFDAV